MLDFIILIFLLFFSILGFFRGFKKELKSFINNFLLLFLSYGYAIFFGKFLIELINLNSGNFHPNIILFIGIFSIYVITTFTLYVIFNIFLNHSSSIGINVINRLFAFIFGLINGFIIFGVFLFIMTFYNNLDYIYDFDNNSFFLDYFFKFGVQLQNVWNHWYS